MRLRFICLLVAWNLAVGGLAASGRADVIDSMAAVCRVECTDPDGTEHLGTGVAFAQPDGRLKILTNAHVVPAPLGSEVQLTFWRRGRPLPPRAGRVEWRSFAAGTARDVAVLSCPAGESPPPCIPLAEKDVPLPVGEAVVSIGCPRGGWPTLFVGQITHHLSAAVEFVPLPASGRSGSPLLSTDGRHILGLVAWQTGDRRRGRAVSLAEIYRALSGEPPGEITPVAERRRTRQAEVAPLAPLVPIAPSAGKPEDAGFG